jgi:Mg2+/Co2+ transporter CorB
MQGLVTLEDILEEIVGEFTSNIADNIEEIFPQKDDSYIINGTINIRDINKTLDWQLPIDGPKTLNGLLLEHLETFPDAVACIGIGNYGFEVLEISEKIIHTARGSALQKYCFNTTIQRHRRYDAVVTAAIL